MAHTVTYNIELKTRSWSGLLHLEFQKYESVILENFKYKCP